MKKHFNLRIKGKVQGVFFRASTQEKAREFGVFGWVRNEEDGEVYIEAEGEENDLNDFINWCRTGPPLAQVKDCTTWEEPMKGFTRFQIIR